MHVHLYACCLKDYLLTNESTVLDRGEFLHVSLNILEWHLLYVVYVVYYRLLSNDMLCETYDDRWATEINIYLMSGYGT